MFVVFLLLILFVIRHDSPKYLIQKGRIDEAKTKLKLMYKSCNNENIDKYISLISETSSEDGSKLKAIDSVCNPRYSRATFVNIGYIILHEFTGINVLRMYSNQIFDDMKAESQSFTPR